VTVVAGASIAIETSQTAIEEGQQASKDCVARFAATAMLLSLIGRFSSPCDSAHEQEKDEG